MVWEIKISLQSNYFMKDLWTDLQGYMNGITKMIVDTHNQRRRPLISAFY